MKVNLVFEFLELQSVVKWKVQSQHRLLSPIDLLGGCVLEKQEYRPWKNTSFCLVAEGIF